MSLEEEVRHECTIKFIKIVMAFDYISFTNPSEGCMLLLSVDAKALAERDSFIQQCYRLIVVSDHDQ